MKSRKHRQRCNLKKAGKNKMDLTLSTNGIGLSAILKDYQRICVEILSDNRDHVYKESKGLIGYSSRDMWIAVNEILQQEPDRRDNPDRTNVSRASVINSLNGLCEHGCVSYGEVTGKGGHRRIYLWAPDAEPLDWFTQLFTDRLASL